MPCVIGVLTCRRPRNASYLERTLESLNREGAKRFPLFVHEDVDLVGDVKASWDLYKRAAGEYPGHDLLVFEDDVEACKGAVSCSGALSVPEDCGFLSFFEPTLRYTANFPMGVHRGMVDYGASRKVANTPVKPGIYRRKMKGTFTYAQAVKIPAKLVEPLAGFDYRTVGPLAIAGNTNKGNGRDMTLGAVMTKLGYGTYGLVCPNWYEHIGGVSAAVMTGHGEITTHRPTSANWNGVEHNAFDDLEFLK